MDAWTRGVTPVFHPLLPSGNIASLFSLFIWKSSFIPYHKLFIIPIYSSMVARPTNFQLTAMLVFAILITCCFTLVNLEQGTFFTTVPLHSETTKCASSPPIQQSNLRPKTNIVPFTDNRMVFTHVGKAGGSYVINVMEALQKRNGFEVVKGALFNGTGFNPPKERLIADLRSLENNTIYENHACYVQGLEDREWISVVRDPLELMNSIFYYSVDTDIRKKSAFAELDKREKDTLCGCFNLEFDECIDTKYKNNCTIDLPMQMSYFCEPRDPNCTLDIALQNVENYLLIGITEEMALTMKMLEMLSPWSFGGQAEVVTVSKRSTNLFNPVTKTILNGAISTRTRKQIKERAYKYNDEIQFYNAVKRMFWRKAAEVGAIL